MILRAENKDCMEIMKEYTDGYFDLSIVDPPYGISINMNMGKKKGELGRYKKKDWDSCIPSELYFGELQRISKNQIIWGGNYFKQHLLPSMGWIVWDKQVPVGVSFSDFELAWSSFNIAAKKVIIPYCGFIGLKGKKRIHPTEKPVKLYEWIYKNYAKPEFKVIDTHLGSGSNLIAADNFKISEFVCCEIDTEYFNDAMSRYNQFKKQLKLF